MAKENVNLDFRLKKYMKKRNYILEEMKHNDLMSKKNENLFRALDYFEHFLIFVPAFS